MPSLTITLDTETLRDCETVSAENHQDLNTLLGEAIALRLSLAKSPYKGGFLDLENNMFHPFIFGKNTQESDQ